MMRNWLVSLWLVAGLAIAQPTVRLAFVGDIDLKGLREPLPVWKGATQPT